MASSRERVSAHRARLRAMGMKPIEIWVPDTSSPVFAAEANRQSLLVSTGAAAAEDQAWVDEVSEWPGA